MYKKTHPGILFYNWIRRRLKMVKLILVTIIGTLFFPMAILAQLDLSNPGNLPEATITGIGNNIMYWLLGFVGVLGVIAFVISGILYLTSAGDDEQIGKAKKAMVYAIVGIIVALIGVIVINAVDSMLNG
jgi:TRAP-type C4-dicarboxylate transport system permease small subunit